MDFELTFRTDVTLATSSRPCGQTLSTGKHLSSLGSMSQALLYPVVLGCLTFLSFHSDDFDQFIRFVNMLMSDTTFHLEESLTGLAKIGQVESQKANTASWGALPQSEREDLEGQLRQAEGSVPWHTQMGLSNVKLIRDFTATTREPFVAPEIVDRLAAVSWFGLMCEDVKANNSSCSPWMRILQLLLAQRCRILKYPIPTNTTSSPRTCWQLSPKSISTFLSSLNSFVQSPMMVEVIQRICL